MTRLSLSQRLDIMVKLGEYLLQDTPQRQAALRLAETQNNWFTVSNCLQSIEGIAQQFLNEATLRDFVARYPALEADTVPFQTVGLVLAGNIPMVGFHDVLCTFLAGHRAYIKLSEKDNALMQYVLHWIWATYPDAKPFLEIVPMLRDFDRVIATGSDNSAVYFEQYFGKYPHIIRKNRNSAAIIRGTETPEEMMRLGLDVFRYFGLGCRSVSKLYVPRGYDFAHLLAPLDNYQDIMNHTKYRNNFEYNRSIYLLNVVPHLANDCIMVLEHESMLSRIATLHYEFYDDEADLQTKIERQLPYTQCIASTQVVPFVQTVPFGQTQSPTIFDYADNVDTMAFLCNISN